MNEINGNNDSSGINDNSEINDHNVFWYEPYSFIRVSKYEPIRYPSVMKNKIIIVRRKPTVAKNIPIIPAAIAPRIALFIFIMIYNTKFLLTVNSITLTNIVVTGSL